MANNDLQYFFDSYLSNDITHLMLALTTFARKSSVAETLTFTQTFTVVREFPIPSMTEYLYG